MRYSIFISLLVFSVFFGFLNVTNAQDFGLGDSVNIKLVPEVPKANEVVYVYLTSYSTNIDLANITWRVNGKNIKSGIGEKVFNFTMGGVGKITTLSLVIRTTEGALIEKSIALKPMSVDLVWQTDGFVPPFYKGKSIFAHQNRVTVVAIPHIIGSSGLEINPKNLLYKWRKDGSVVENASGYGKSSYTFEASLISRPVNINVEVSSEQGFGYATLNLKPTKPNIVFYKKDPVYGIQFQKVLSGDVELTNSSEISIVATPFFFNNYLSLGYNWGINGKQVEGGGGPNQIFRQKEGVVGTSKISLSIENPEKILQFTTNNFNLVFGNKNNN